ncbi:MAG TPA: ATP-binding protein [Dyella sp.]|uniref:ATP-binding protein n=1 Tax=Dyella sp. TaxID=1869338 RepID=UPI002D784173|nr:ATP-binding protein [Dyella sp.]HET6555330.1 ATP-binding protein [Dyella sp.]
MPHDAARATQLSFLSSSESGLGTIMRDMDWSQSPLGTPEGWSLGLRTTVAMLLAARAQIVLFWGPHFVALYNDAYAPTIGDKHPRALGRPASECWSELWEDLEPLLCGVRETGNTFAAADRPFYIERHGYGETVYFDVSYSAVPEADGSVGGVLCIVSETTGRVLSARRQDSLLQLEDALRGTSDADAAKRAAVELLCRELDITSVQYADVDLAQSSLSITSECRSDGRPSVAGTYPLGELVADVGALRGAEPFFGEDTAGSDPVEGAATALVDADASPCVLNVPVLRGDKVMGLFLLRYPRGRHWSDEAIQFVRSVVQRSWNAAERARSEALLRDSEARQRQDAERVQMALAAGAIIGTWLWDLPNDRITVDEQFAFHFGLDPSMGREGLHLAQVLATVHPDDVVALQAAIAEASGCGGTYAHQCRVRRADGRYYWVEGSGRVEMGPDGVAVSFPGVLIDVEARHQAEQRLATSEAKYRALFESVDEGFCVIELLDGPHGALSDYIHVEANPAYEINSGIPRIVGRRLRELIPDDADGWIDIYRRVLLTGEPVRFERELGMTERYLELSAFRVEPPERRQVAVLFKDITERKRDETELKLINRELAERVAQAVEEREAALARIHEMQKLETIGQLTGGVAHDFNNLLTPIVGALDMLSRHSDNDDRTRRLIAAGLQAAERARTLVQRLLAFARRQHLEARPIDVPHLVRGMEDLLARSLGPQIVLTISCDANLPSAYIDPNQFELALLNLAVNARDAMPEGGELKVDVAAAQVQGQPKLTDGRYIRVAVTDNGSGMDAETISRAVDPFFTTKAKGQGTGLGLSMVHGLAAQSGGGFTLSSVPGQGTTATMWLPVSLVEANHGASSTAARVELQRSQATPVLLVDDEELVRAGTAEMLSDAGYVVRQASSGRQALAMLADGLHVDALVTDYAMPGMTGAQLASEVSRLHPGLPVLMITGFASLQDHFISDLPRLAKPFRQTELADALAGLLRER